MEYPLRTLHDATRRYRNHLFSRVCSFQMPGQIASYRASIACRVSVENVARKVCLGFLIVAGHADTLMVAKVAPGDSANYPRGVGQPGTSRSTMDDSTRVLTHLKRYGISRPNLPCVRATRVSLFSWRPKNALCYRTLVGRLLAGRFRCAADARPVLRSAELQTSPRHSAPGWRRLSSSFALMNLEQRRGLFCR